MLFSQILTPQMVLIDAKSQSKTAVLRQLSQLFHADHPGITQQALFQAYWNRELLGSTTIGNGIIIPHIHMPMQTGPKGCLIKLVNPVDFGAKDKQPIDLVIGLLSPQNQNELHLSILSNIVRVFSSPDFCKACRKTNDCASLYALMLKKELQEEPALLGCL